MRRRAALLWMLGSACGRAAPPAARGGAGRYFLVGNRAARTFSSPGAPPSGELSPGYGLSIVEERLQGGRRLGRSASGRWVAMSDLVAARPAAFKGVVLRGGEAVAEVAWVVSPSAPVLAEPSAGARRIAVRMAFTRERISASDGAFLRTAGGWMRRVDLRVPGAAPRPGLVGPLDRWLDVDLISQTLVAYEGDRPTFTTLVSTGIGSPGSPISTPEGLFRIRSKHLTATMDNLEHTDVVPYRYEDIPLVQYFTDRVALHAALWHQRFGHPASHGCVNLTPSDAQHLFDFTTPRLPSTEREVYARAQDASTTVRVRRG
jgi:hypothetical protein